VTNIFHAQSKVEVKDFERNKLALLKTKGKSKQASRASLKVDSERKRAEQEKDGKTGSSTQTPRNKKQKLD
jgi:hypothetical protein